MAKSSKKKNRRSSRVTILNPFINPFHTYDEDVQVHVVDISIRSVLMTLGTFALLFLIYSLRTVFFILFLAFIISAALSPSYSVALSKALMTVFHGRVGSVKTAKVGSTMFKLLKFGQKS